MNPVLLEYAQNGNAENFYSFLSWLIFIVFGFLLLFRTQCSAKVFFLLPFTPQTDCALLLAFLSSPILVAHFCPLLGHILCALYALHCRLLLNSCFPFISHTISTRQTIKPTQQSMQSVQTFKNNKKAKTITRERRQWKM